MGKAKNARRSRNPFPWRQVGFWVGVAVMAAVVLSAFVVVKNSHLQLGEEKRRLEEEIVRLEVDVETSELWLGRLLERSALSSRLRSIDSDLREVLAAEVIEVEVGESGVAAEVGARAGAGLQVEAVNFVRD